MKDGWSKVSLFTKNQLWDRKERENWRFLRRSRKSEGNDDDCLSSILWGRSGGNIGKHQFVWENNQFMSFLTKSVWFFVIYSLIFSSRLLEYMESAHTAIMPRFLAHNLYSKKCRIFKRQWDCLSLSIISTVRCSYNSSIQRSNPSLPSHPHIALSVQYHSMVIWNILRL